MKRVLYCFVVVTTLVGISAAQSGPARYNLDFGPTGVFPLSGFRTFGDSAGLAGEVVLNSFLSSIWARKLGSQRDGRLAPIPATGSGARIPGTV
jgi:hypothetical protein